MKLLSILKQALRKFSETAKGWYWNIGKLNRKYTVKLYPNIVLVHCCTMLCTGVNIVLNRVFILNYVYELKMSGKCQTFCLLLIYLKHSIEKNVIFHFQ